MSEKEFPKGFMVKPPHEKAPDFVKMRVSIRVHEFQAFLSEKGGEWVNIDIKTSKDGKLYAEVDNWKPEKRPHVNERDKIAKPKPSDKPFEDDKIPF